MYRNSQIGLREENEIGILTVTLDIYLVSTNKVNNNA